MQRGSKQENTNWIDGLERGYAVMQYGMISCRIVDMFALC